MASVTTTQKLRAVGEQAPPEEPIKPPLELRAEGRPFDAILLAAVLALVGLGLVMVYSASAVQMPWQGLEPAFYLKRQLGHVGIGLVLMLLGLRTDYRWWRRYVYPVLFGTLGLLVMVLVFGVERNGAQRWFSLFGFSMQPAEILKIVVVMYMAYSLEKKNHKVSHFTIGIIPHLMVLGVISVLLLLQPDFGSTVICAALMFTMLFVAGARVVYMTALGGIAAVLGGVAILSSDYRTKRLMAWLNPEEGGDASSYQTQQSMMAIGSGGMTGKGLGEGVGKLGYVPELWNDFIGTAIGEELGLMGLALVCGLFGVLLWRGLKIAFGAREGFGMYLAFGLTLLMGIQAFVNLAVVTGTLPNKGLTLPFVSYGGSAILMSLFAIGVMLNISMAKEDEVGPALALRAAQKSAQRVAKRRPARRNPQEPA